MSVKLRKCILGGLFLAVQQYPAWSAPTAYELLLESQTVTLPDRVGGLLERNLPQVKITPILPAQRYREYAQFPVPACNGDEYFLLAHGKRLIAFGCLRDSSAAAEVQKIRRALQADRDTVGERSTESLYDGALHSAAAGQWPEARRYAGAAGIRAPTDARLVERLQRLLRRQQ
jgi:hypothetical protein